ncbi:uncharacterized protein GIQ15_06683 [Arthroderma uncinatum]|uniref:uncharacterized protein n=1 Tax=Arthroderma uncinatum TaxID=74035 RepID=UPI00144ADD94|nr:uncharacterized protein GIQ15_06683 [Arthroderma uncinatum]KAF3479707.1 hypothetical protein GIQ15_06683 [Arthroderma uncinatum]
MARTQSKDTDRRSSSNRIHAFVIVLSFVGALVIAIFVTFGCISTDLGLNHLYYAELRANGTYDVSLRVGYFGGCMSISRAPVADAGASGSSSTRRAVYCIKNMHTEAAADLSESFQEHLNVTGDMLAFTNSFLSIAILHVKHLQENVFFYEPVAIQVALLGVSGLMLFAAVGAPSHRRGYKGVVALAIFLATFAIALGLVIAIGSIQAMNAVLGGGRPINEKLFNDSIVISRGSRLDGLQGALAATTTLFYVLIGMLFVRWSSEGEREWGGENFIQVLLPERPVWGRRGKAITQF